MNRRTCGMGAAKVTGLVLMAFSSNATGNLTDVVASRFGQPDPRQIVSRVYDDPVTAVGMNFGGNTLTVTRIPDESTQEELTGQQFAATAVARFSDYTQSYGVIDASGNFTPSFEVSGKNYNVSGSGTVQVNSGESFGRSGNSGMDSSTPPQNADGRDHVVTYRIDGAKPDPQYLQFWEDLDKTPGLAKGRTTSDFNDLVVRLEPASVGDGGTGGTTVPLPPAFWCTSVMGLGMLARKASRAPGRRVRPFRR